MSAAAGLLVELSRRGIELRVHGNRLRYRPRTALTPELADRLKAHKPALLALLRQDRPTEIPLHPEDRSAEGRTSSTSRADQLEAPEPQDSCDVPHELSLAERVETGYVNPGWTAKAWADRLCQLADRCEALRPELATQYRTWAGNVRNS